MTQQLPSAITDRLQLTMEELFFEIAEIKEYLAAPVMFGNEAVLPLGIMGDIMSSELIQETTDIAEQAHYIACEEGVDDWEKVKKTVDLHRKIALLMTITNIISQLPALNGHAKNVVTKLSQRIIDQCKTIDDMLNMLVSDAINTPQPVAIK